MINPSYIKSKEFILQKNDFMGGLHQTLYITIYNLAHQGAKEIKLADIETYLYNTDPLNYDKVFNKNEGVEWINKVLLDANESNFEYYYNIVRKLSLLRSYINEGFDVSDILDVDEVEPNTINEKGEIFNNSSIKEIINKLDKKNMSAKMNFLIDDDTVQRKAGDNAEELREEMKLSPSYGLNTESEYINTIIRGILPGKFLLETRDSGMGKTRVAIKRLLCLTAPYIWDYKKKEYIENPNGTNNSGLYLGTEMDTYKELEPMMWAFVSGVEEKKIKDNDLTEEEEGRVNAAISILKNTKLYLVDQSEYDIAYLWHIFEEYKIKHNICVAAIDYLELTTAMAIEYSQMNRGMNVREDQVLLNLSKNIKNMAKQFQLFIMGFTQTTDEARRDGVRDQRAIKGARSLPNKVDFGITTFEPTQKELELIEPLLLKKGLVDKKTPNIVYTFYKNRSTEYKKVKVWGWQNLGNMEYYDLFCTDEGYNLINIDKTFTKVGEDNKTPFENKE